MGNLSPDPTELEQRCPLCGNSATYKVRKLGKAKLFSCPECTSFALYIDAEESLSRIKDRYKQSYSRNARECANNQVLVLDIQFELADIISTSRESVPLQYATICPYYELRSNWL